MRSLGRKRNTRRQRRHSKSVTKPWRPSSNGSSDDIAELEIELIQKENEKAKLKACVEVMVAAVTRSRASLADASTATMYVVEIPHENNLRRRH